MLLVDMGLPVEEASHTEGEYKEQGDDDADHHATIHTPVL